MSTEVIVATPKPLTLQQRALVAIGDRDEAALQKLAEATKDITTITNDDGYKQIQSARIVLKNERISIEKDGKKAREDATAFGKAVIKEEDRLIAIISPEEKRLQKLQDDWDTEIERVRQAKIDEELKRVADLQERVAELRGCQTLSPTSGAELVANHIADLERLEVNDSFQEFQQQAEDAKAAGLARLRAVYTAAVTHEAEQASIKAEREELARLREAEALRVAQENARRAEEERAAKVARDAETARHNEQLRKQREEQEAAAKAERMRIADEEAQAKKLRDAESARLAAERADLARQQEELRKAQEQTPPARVLYDPAAEFPLHDYGCTLPRESDFSSVAKPGRGPGEFPKAVTRGGIAIQPPSAAEIIDVLAKHYRAHPDTVVDWLRQTDFSQERAA